MNRCPSCARDIPADATFCIYCAAPLRVAPPARSQEPATGATIRLDPPPAPAPVHPRRPRGAKRVRPHRKSRRQDTLGPVFLLGILFLLVTRTFWPGILVLLGLMHFVRAANRGQSTRVLKQFVFLGGMALLFWSGFFWPGILVLMLASHLLSSRRLCWRP